MQGVAASLDSMFPRAIAIAGLGCFVCLCIVCLVLLVGLVVFVLLLAFSFFTTGDASTENAFEA